MAGSPSTRVPSPLLSMCTTLRSSLAGSIVFWGVLISTRTALLSAGWISSPLYLKVMSTAVISLVSMESSFMASCTASMTFFASTALTSIVVPSGKMSLSAQTDTLTLPTLSKNDMGGMLTVVAGSSSEDSSSASSEVSSDSSAGSSAGTSSEIPAGSSAGSSAGASAGVSVGSSAGSSAGLSTGFSVGCASVVAACSESAGPTSVGSSAGVSGISAAGSSAGISGSSISSSSAGISGSSISSSSAAFLSSNAASSGTSTSIAAAMEDSPVLRSSTRARNTLRSLLRDVPVQLCLVLFMFASSCFRRTRCGHAERRE